MATLKGMNDALKREQIFNLQYSFGLFFSAVNYLIKAVYQEIGQKNLFKLGYKAMQINLPVLQPWISF